MAVYPLASSSASAASVTAAGDLTVTRPVGVFPTTFLETPTSGARAGVADHAGHEVLAGSIDGDFGLVRVQRWVDNGFGHDDLVVTDFGGADDAANAVALGDDGFGSFGKVTLDLGGADDSAYGAAVLADRRVLGGRRELVDADVVAPERRRLERHVIRFAGVARFSADGPARGLVVQADGRAVVVGGETDRIWATRVLADGTPDASFGQAGTASALLGAPTSGRAVTLTPDGAIVAAGTSHGHVALAQFRPNGALDPAFGSGGTVVDDLGGTARHTACTPTPLA